MPPSDKPAETPPTDKAAWTAPTLTRFMQHMFEAGCMVKPDGVGGS